MLTSTRLNALVVGDHQHDRHQGLLVVVLGRLVPDAVSHADEVAVGLGGAPEAGGAEAVAGFMRGARRARGSQTAPIDGEPSMVWPPGGRPRVILRLTIDRDKVTAVDATADPEDIARTDLVIIGRPPA